MANFFIDRPIFAWVLIDRPIFAWVLAILLCLGAGNPVVSDRYPVVSDRYPGDFFIAR